MRHRASRSLLDRLLLHHRPGTVVAAVVLLAVGLVTASVVTASGPPDRTDAALEQPSYPGASYNPPTPSGTSSNRQEPSPSPSDEASPSSSPSTRPSEGQVSRSSNRAPAPTTAPSTPTAEAPPPTATPEEPPADAPQTTATTRSTSASRWVIGVGSDTDATYECSLDGGAFEQCGPTVTYDDLDKGTHSFAARATDGAGNTDPSPATLTAEIGPPGQG